MVATFSTYSLSEKAIVIQLGSTIDNAVHHQVISLNRLLNREPFEGFIETVPAYNTITIYYDPLLVYNSTAMKGNAPSEKVNYYLQHLLASLPQGPVIQTNSLSIPVCYDAEMAPDLNWVAKWLHTSIENIVQLHTSSIYTVYMLGFSPGFPYMGKLDSRLSVPRKETPRAKVEPGSVGIAGEQTGIYPFAGPGGWQLIGRTPVTLFDPAKDDPVLLHPGDQVRFTSITKEEFYQMQPNLS
jgi:inhibitor of KinA